ncbi:MAG TPA: hypothetical protein VN696_14895 [Pyrinomonadaceae bacterium]|nr:hypothetical protein [Pyrinomonadaceae bacterium]
MFKRNSADEQHLDRAGTVILRAAAADEKKIEAASESPFLFTRVRARIAEQLRENESGGWQSLPLIAWRAIPAMALIAMLAGGLTIWTGSKNSNVANQPSVWYRLDDEALADTNDPGVEQTVLSRNNLSHEDVLDIVIERGAVENKK